MTQITSELHINAPKQRVWEIVADLGAVVNFHPFIQNSYYITDQKEGVSAARICEFPNGTVVEETTSDWIPGEKLSLQVEFTKGQKPPVTGFSGTIALSDDGNGTLVEMVGNYQPKFGLLGAVMDRVMLRPQYNKMFPAILQGLKHHAETGEVVNTRVLKRIQSAAVATA